eukprot:GFUD01029105.1.p1 GENE.GFUD01029105.1~~GFUD01029105.1.p1  ORF type:complete len:519 (+),score=132.75 GFUD01029105.1:145-1557(+)
MADTPGLLLLFSVLISLCRGQFSPDWPSLDSRPLPAWYDEAKVGVFMHWGPYSVPGVASEWFWLQWNRRDPANPGDMEIVKYMEDFYPPDFKYQQFGSQFSAEFFNATFWAELVAASGAKYFVFTSKHHDGFNNWPSKRNFGWNSQDIGPKRDVVGELAEAFRAENKVVFGLYHSLFEWYHPLYLQDKANNYTTKYFVEEKMGPELMELVTKYQPAVLWSDGDWEADPEFWDSLKFLSWLYSESPVKDKIVTNDRWGRGVLCKHGDFFTCSDRYNPGVLQNHKWENAMTIDKESWGFRRNMKLSDILTMEELITELAVTVSCGGNLLMNVGPNKDGIIDTIFEERLRQMGDWLGVNGEAIYGSKPWTHQNDSLNGDVWFTSKLSPSDGQVVYAILLAWPESGKLELGSPRPGQDTKVTLLGLAGTDLKWTDPAGQVTLAVDLPELGGVGLNWGWVFKMVKLENGGNSIWK